jgi:tRNA modification GTPase
VESCAGREIYLSAKTGAGIELLEQYFKVRAGYNDAQEGVFSARRRHFDALKRTREHVEAARSQLLEANAGELAAESLRYAHQALGEITGEFAADDLLGEIFSSFCIGK